MIVWEGSSGRLSTLNFGTALLLTLPGVGSFLPGPNRGGLWNPPSLQVGLTFGELVLHGWPNARRFPVCATPVFGAVRTTVPPDSMPGINFRVLAEVGHTSCVLLRENISLEN